MIADRNLNATVAHAKSIAKAKRAKQNASTNANTTRGDKNGW